MRPLMPDAGVDGSLPGPAVARAGNGVVYGYGEPLQAAAKRVIEYGPAGMERWPSPGADLELMRRVKQMFDPKALLNPGGLYGRI